MGGTAPCGVGTARFVMDSAFETVSAFRTLNPSRKTVSVLVFFRVPAIALFLAPLPQHGIGPVEILMADDCGMIVLDQILVKLPVICMAVETAVCISLLIKNIACIFFIADDSIYRPRRPTAAFLGQDSLRV